MIARKTKIGILFCICALALFLAWLVIHSKTDAPGGWMSSPHASTASSVDIHQRAIDSIPPWIAAYQKPIEFYGKVVDQHGDAVSGASVTISPFNNSDDESKSRLDLTSDTDGRFHVVGIKGAKTAVWVRKTGYLTRTDLTPSKPTSTRLVESALDDPNGERLKDPGKPVLFTLHKLGPMEPLVYVKKHRCRLPVDGTPKHIALDSEKGQGPHRIEFKFTTEWAKFPKDSDALFGMFDWKLEMRIPGGGFAKSKSDYLFEAPAEGYEESIRIDQPKSSPNWAKMCGGRYFVKFADGTYGRIRFTIEGYSDTSPLMMTSWLNPQPGSLNLTSDKMDGSLMQGE